MPVLDEARWRVALARGMAGLWDLNPRIEMVHYSAPWKARLGFPRIDMPDSTSSWRSRVHPDDYEAMLRRLRLHLDGYTATYEAQFRLRAGPRDRYIAVQSRGRVLERDARGDPLRMMGTMVSLSTALGAPLTDPQPRAGNRCEAAPSLGLPVGALDDGTLAQMADLLDLAARHVE